MTDGALTTRRRVAVRGARLSEKSAAATPTSRQAVWTVLSARRARRGSLPANVLSVWDARSSGCEAVQGANSIVPKGAGWDR